MNRPTRVQTYMDLAHVYAKRSTCHRLNVGAVIVYNRTPISFGYNGVPAGDPHCSGNDCPGKQACNLTIHAEVNAISRIPPLSPYEVSSLVKVPRYRTDLDMFVTDSPCPDCCRLIKHSHVRRVFFSNLYRITTHLDWLVEHGVEAYRVTPAGYVIRWPDNEVVGIEI